MKAHYIQAFKILKNSDINGDTLFRVLGGSCIKKQWAKRLKVFIRIQGNFSFQVRSLKMKLLTAINARTKDLFKKRLDSFQLAGYQ